LSDDELTFASTAGALWLQGENRATAVVLANAPSGWRNARLPRQSVVLRHGERTIDVRYRTRRDGSFDVGENDVARVHRWGPHDIDVEVSGRRRSSRITRSGTHLHVQVVRGTVDFELVPRFVAPGVELVVGGLSAPMPGVVIEVRVVVGQRVAVGETLVVMEAMKMEHVISAPSAGIVSEVLVTASQQVDNGAVLLTIDDEGVG
jgi:propionyl-CoA carboxylase alpha chain